MLSKYFRTLSGSAKLQAPDRTLAHGQLARIFDNGSRGTAVIGVVIVIAEAHDLVVAY